MAKHKFHYNAPKEQIRIEGLYIPRDVLQSKSFMDFTASTSYKYWLTLTDYIAKLPCDNWDLFQYIHETFYNKKRLLATICPDEEIKRRLGCQTNSYLNRLKNNLINMGFIWPLRFEFENKERECLVLGEYYYDNDMYLETFYAYDQCLRLDNIRSVVKGKGLKVA